MALQTQVAIAEDEGFRRRLRQALIQEAIAIFAELDTTENHAARLALAKEILRGGADDHVSRLAYIIPTFAVVETAGAGVDDATLKTTLSGVINAYTQVVV